MKTVIKFLMSDISEASRDKREINTLLEMGIEVIIICREISNKNEKILSQCNVIQYRSPELSYSQMRLIRYLKIIRHWLRLASTLKSLEADCISCHDLTALFIGWMSTIRIHNHNMSKPKLVYDSHEFEIGRNIKRNKLKICLIPVAERFLIKKCAFSIMVNDSIADEVQKIHSLKDRPVVVRNVPNLWQIDKTLCEARRNEFCNKMNSPEGTFIIMYHGGVLRNRGIENMLFAVQKINDIAAIILGDGDASYIQELKQLTEGLEISNRVLFHKAVPIGRLWEYVGAADLGIILIQNTCRSYYLSLPNKLFENIQSGTPVVASNFPELSKIVEGYKIGLCCNPADILDITKTIINMKDSTDQYLQFKKNVIKAREELIWEKEKDKLWEAYKNV